MAGLNVSLPLIATIAQEIISLYTLWDRYKDDKPSAGDSVRSAVSAASPFTGVGAKRTADEMDNTVTPRALTRTFLGMREARMADLAHPSNGRPLAVNKMLERTQSIL